jgi:hypothetical protein
MERCCTRISRRPFTCVQCLVRADNIAPDWRAAVPCSCHRNRQTLRHANPKKLSRRQCLHPNPRRRGTGRPPGVRSILVHSNMQSTLAAVIGSDRILPNAKTLDLKAPNTFNPLRLPLIPLTRHTFVYEHHRRVRHERLGYTDAKRSQSSR